MLGPEHIWFAIGWLVLLTLAIGAKSAAPWVRTKKAQREALLDALQLPPNALVYDIGCGDGAVLFSIVDRFPSVRGVGIEIAILPFVLALVTKFVTGKKYRNVRFKYRDFFGQSVADADAVFLFLLPPAYPRVVRKLAAELRDDAVVAVEGWPFPGVAIDRVSEKTPNVMPIYFYRGRALREAALNANV